MLRRIAEKLSRGVAFRRRLPRSVGGALFYVSPDSALSYLKPGARAFDENLLRLAFENIRADSRVWDIGANVGVFTFAAAGLARAGHVLAVEADVWLSQLIRRSAWLHENRSMRIDVLTAAIAQQNGVSSFNIAQRGRSSNYLDEAGGRTEAGGVRTRVCVPTLTLDTLLQRFSAPTDRKSVV